MTISSIHFQKAQVEFAEKHNFRTEQKEPEYLLEKRYRKTNEYLKLHDVKELYQEQMQIRKNNHCRGFAPSLKDVYWEAVINLEERHTLSDVKKVAEHIRQKYKLQTCSIAIHHDEGYKDKNDTVKYNNHAHLCFLTMENGISTMRKIRSKELRQMQSEVAQLLGMERGKENSKAVRLDHKQYREVKRAEDSLNQETARWKSLYEQAPVKTQKQLEELKSEIRKQMIEQGGFSAQDYRALNKLITDYKKAFKLGETVTVTEVVKDIYKRVNASIELKKKNKEYNDTVNGLNNKITSLEQQLETKPKEVVKEVEKIVTVKRELTEIEIEKLPRVQELNRTIKTLKENEKGLIVQKDYFDKAYNAELKIHQQLQTDYKTLQAENTELKDKLKTLFDFNRTVLDFIKAIHSDFDINHPIPSLKKIYYDWKNRTQKSSITTLKRSITNENTIERVEVLPSMQNRTMSVLGQKTTEEKKYRIMFGANECFMTAQDIRDWLTDYPEEHDSIAQQLSESDRREVFGVTQKEQRHSPRVDHHFSR